MARPTVAYLKLEGVHGESQDSQFEGQIELLSWGWGVSNSSSGASGTGHSTSKGQIHDFHFTKHTDRSSPELFIRCANGEHISKGKLSVVKLSGENKIVYKELEFDKVFVTSWTPGGHDADNLPVESVSLAFVEVKFFYTPQADTGSPESKIDKGWNLQKNKAV